MQLRNIWASSVVIQLTGSQYVKRTHLKGKLYELEKTDIH